LRRCWGASPMLSTDGETDVKQLFGFGFRFKFKVFLENMIYMLYI
jgi:hypothetical protein